MCFNSLHVLEFTPPGECGYSRTSADTTITYRLSKNVLTDSAATECTRTKPLRAATFWTITPKRSILQNGRVKFLDYSLSAYPIPPPGWGGTLEIS